MLLFDYYFLFLFGIVTMPAQKKARPSPKILAAQRQEGLIDNPASRLALHEISLKIHIVAIPTPGAFFTPPHPGADALGLPQSGSS